MVTLKEQQLLVAAHKGDAAKVRVLLWEGTVDVDARVEDGRTALHEASRTGSTGIVKMLLRANATTDLVDQNGMTPLHHASAKRRSAVVDLLLKAEVKPDVPDNFGETALYEASTKGYVDGIRLLLNADANPNLTNKEGKAALHQASSKGYVEAVDLLLKAKANPDVTDKSGRTALHEATAKGHAEVVKLLLSASANPNAADESGQTPLHIACSGHNSRIVRLLLAFHSNIHAQDKDAWEPLHHCLVPRTILFVTKATLQTLQVLVAVGAKWNRKCDEIVSAGEAYTEAHALRICMELWTQEHADSLLLTDVPVEVVRRGAKNTQDYVDSLKASRDIVFRRKICLVGSSCAGKTSLVKSISTKKPELEHADKRTIGIDHFPLRFEQRGQTPEDIKVHEVTFWDFAGQDAYQVAHSLFFSPRTMYLVCIDLEAFTTAFLQASIMSYVEKQECRLMDEFIDRTVMQWVRMIMARQPDAEFVFIATKKDSLKENKVTRRLLKNALLAKLKEVEATIQKMRNDLKAKQAAPNENSSSDTKTADVVFVSCVTEDAVQTARGVMERLIGKSDRSFQMPESYSRALADIAQIRKLAKGKGITKRIVSVFASVDSVPVKLQIEPELCHTILQTLHDLGDVLWYEDLGVDMFKNTVILDPLLLIDFIRQVINHHNTGQTMPHSDLKASPYWNGLEDRMQMKAMKQVLQKFHLVYSADKDRRMAWDSDLIVPAYWQTKPPAAWCFVGDILRINSTYSCEGEVARVHWEYHFDYGLPPSLFDQLVVACVSPYFTFDAGPDWIVFEEKEFTACRIMVGRDRKSLQRTMHVEAVVSKNATNEQAKELWGSFQRMHGAFMDVMAKHPGLHVSSFAWGANKKIGLKRLARSDSPPPSATWMPPSETWEWTKGRMLQNMKGEMN